MTCSGLTRLSLSKALCFSSGCRMNYCRSCARLSLEMSLRRLTSCVSKFWTFAANFRNCALGLSASWYIFSTRAWIFGGIGFSAYERASSRTRFFSIVSCSDSVSAPSVVSGMGRTKTLPACCCHPRPHRRKPDCDQTPGHVSCSHGMPLFPHWHTHVRDHLGILGSERLPSMAVSVVLGV